MTIESIRKARFLSQRFDSIAREVLDKDTYEFETLGKKKLKGLNHGKRTGALRRASMDLTRALAEMRRP